MNPVYEFLDAMRSAGIDTDYVPQGTGHIERFHINGDKAGKKNGWCILFLDWHSVGTFGNWKTGHRHVWFDKRNKPTTQDRINIQNRIKSGQQKRDYEYKQAQLKAGIVWRNATEANVS